MAGIEPGAHASPGEGAILVGMNAAEVHKVVESDLDSVPYVAGVNNHMGSRATQDAALMAEVMKTLAGHRLYFIDSRTTAALEKFLPDFERADIELVEPSQIVRLPELARLHPPAGAN